MILTEEQREAIRAVSDLPRAIGCTRCHNYIQKNYSNQFAVLRSMIDNKDYVPNAAKLIELLAAGEHEQWADWAQSILDSEPGLSEGRKAAWPGMIATPYENLSEELKDKDRREVHLRSSVALDIVQQQAAEIERLRPYEKVAADLAACGSYVGIGPGEGELPIPERVRRCVNRLKETQHEYEQKIISKDARIKKLEDALAEERARGNHYGMEYEDAIEGEIERWIIDGEKDSPKFYLDRVREEARRQLQAEGKIGPDAAKPQSWQITEERIGLLEYCLETLLDAPDIEEIPSPGHSIEMLRAMLREAEQCE